MPPDPEAPLKFSGDPFRSLASSSSAPQQRDRELALAWSRNRELTTSLEEARTELASERGRRFELEDRVAELLAQRRR